MANRRMFSLRVIDTDEFLDMPQSSQYLYYNLAMRADDDGFVANPKRIMRMVGCNDDDLKVLALKQFIIPFEKGICVIRHWRIHNLIRQDRYVETEYLDEKSCLLIKNGKYEKIKGLKGNVIPNGNQMTPQVRLGKVRLGKVRLGNGSAGKSPQPLKKPKTDDNEPMDLQAFMVYCEKSPQKHIQVIGAYAELKKPKFATYGQWQSFIKRNLRPARLLSPYTEEQLGEAMLKIQKRQDKSNGGYITEWTLETLTKFLDH